MSMVPRSDISSPIQRFSAPPRWNAWGRHVALGAATAAMIATVYPFEHSIARTALFVGMAALFAAAWLLAVWEESLEVADDGSFAYRRGFRPFEKRIEGKSISAVSLISSRHG